MHIISLHISAECQAMYKEIDLYKDNILQQLEKYYRKIYPVSCIIIFCAIIYFHAIKQEFRIHNTTKISI